MCKLHRRHAGVTQHGEEIKIQLPQEDEPLVFLLIDQLSVLVPSKSFNFKQLIDSAGGRLDTRL